MSTLLKVSKHILEFLKKLQLRRQRLLQWPTVRTGLGLHAEDAMLQLDTKCDQLQRDHLHER